LSSTTQIPPAVLDERVRRGLPVVRKVARHLRAALPASTPVDFDDLVSVGSEALVHVARSFNDQASASFEAWVSIGARSAMLDWLRSPASGRALTRKERMALKALEAGDAVETTLAETQRLPRGVTKEQAERILEEQLAKIATAQLLGYICMGDATDPTEAPDEKYARAQALAAMNAAVAELDEPQRRFIEGYYFHDRTLKELAAELQCSEPTASRMHHAIVAKLSKKIGRP
jgi:RNA polymerase sigma factor for flagellar operon FliA